MLSFENDYSRAAHPAVLEAVAEANNHLYSGYGSDELSDQAKAKIREACGQPDADVWFLVGGTQTNQVVIDTITPAYAGVVAVASGHSVFRCTNSFLEVSETFRLFSKNF